MQVVPKLWDALHALQAWLHPPAPQPLVPIDDWPLLARQQTRCCFVPWLAGQVASDLLACKPRHVTLEEVAQAVHMGSASGLQQHAEHFLQNYYYVFPMDIDGHFCRMLTIFRHLVRKRLGCQVH